MKHLFCLLLTATAFASCSNPAGNSSDQHKRLELVPEPDKDLREEYEKQQHMNKQSCMFSSPDRLLAGIELRNEESIPRMPEKQNKNEKTK